MKLQIKTAAGLVCWLLVAPPQGLANDKNSSHQIAVGRNGRAPKVDGYLSKNEWKNAAVVYDFTQKEPSEGLPVSEPTFILITYDHKNIYFGIRCFDNEPEKIVASEMRRDSDLSHNDYVEIIIDTFHDKRNAYYFATNSLGARLDSEIKTEGAHINWEWDGIWHTSAHRDHMGWTVEVEIPFSTLRFKAGDNIVWGINFGRYIPRKREEAYWTPISRDDDFDDYGKFKVSKFGVLKGIRYEAQDQRIQIKPYAIGGMERIYIPTVAEDRVTDVGLDAKLRLTSNITSDITVNTDFAQVEADLEQVNLSRFNLFFPEKRDFFLEGSDIFNVGEEVYGEPFTLLFFSRQLGLHTDASTFETREVPIMGGVKTTGKAGPFEIGLLDVLTDELDYINLDSNRVVMPKTNYFSLRMKRDIFKRSYLGVMALSKDQIDGGSYNRTVGIDGMFSFDNNLTLNGYVAKTFTPGLKGNDYNSFLDLSWGSDKVYARGTFTDIGQNFNPEMGFLQWRDIRKYFLEFYLSPRPNLWNIRQTHFSYSLEYITNHNNDLQYRTINLGFLNIFKNEAYVSLGFINYYDNVPATGFFLGPAFVPGGIYKYNLGLANFSSDHSRKLSASLRLGAGTFYDGTFLGVRMENYWKPTTKLRLDANWDWNHVDTPFANGKFTTSVLGARINYSFSTNLFTKVYLQWNDFDKRFISNFLIRYIYSPGSDFYLVYNEELDTSLGLRTYNRTLLAKLTYLLNF